MCVKLITVKSVESCSSESDKILAKKRIKTVCIVLMALLLVIIGVISTARYMAYNIDTLSTQDLEDIDLNSVKKLMIVAHPDDDSIWGGAHLLEGDYLVVCITNGKNDTRSAEFNKVIEKSGCQGLILNYPDKVLGVRDDWEHVEDKINEDIQKLIKLKAWELIVTHNPKGEYGHQHHIMTSGYVTEIAKKCDVKSKLYYFGKYYKKSDIDSAQGLVTIDDETYKKKMELLELYESQKKTVDKFSHMLRYEMWQKAE